MRDPGPCWRYYGPPEPEGDPALVPWMFTEQDRMLIALSPEQTHTYAEKHGARGTILWHREQNREGVTITRNGSPTIDHGYGPRICAGCGAEFMGTQTARFHSRDCYLAKERQRPPDPGFRSGGQ